MTGQRLGVGRGHGDLDHPELYASGNFTQARFGEVDLSINGPLDNPTNVVAPGAPANRAAGLERPQPDPARRRQHHSEPAAAAAVSGRGNTLRTGDTIPGLTGNVSYSFGSYEIHPTAPVDFTRVNVRPAIRRKSAGPSRWRPTTC